MIVDLQIELDDPFRLIARRESVHTTILYDRPLDAYVQNAHSSQAAGCYSYEGYAIHLVFLEDVNYSFVSL